ncbi:hypothetical protein NHX12_027752 [Muraenolepis orangiensis]|uniref:Reverse transcriptase domain-containing protein n=1 Tax=Muraenolepis orangiensis TaxID=630683 RepID=A0A9Q0EG44_9TELE|nr:hypothetical protein NHX12_027752 [Muraenolepis orangiensis]
MLQKKRLELSSFLQERVKGALVRCHFLEIKEMDAPTPFFFKLERSVAQRKQMSCLKLPGGRVTSSPGEMRNHAMDFYTNLFGGEQCSIEGREEILEGPQLSPEEKAALDLELTLEELTGAVNQMASGRAPGIDGFSREFLKHFWGIFGADLHGVFSECFRTGSLPASCRRALYSLAIEPLLCRLRNKLSGLSLPASCGLERPPTLSAYADDVSIFVSSQRDIQCLQETLSLYERASSARLFLLNPEELDLSGLTPFYTSVLQAWHTFKFTSATSEMLGMWVFEEPLFFNGLLRARTLQSASLRTSLREAGCTKDFGSGGEGGLCCPARVLRAFAEDTDLCEQWIEDGDYSFPSLQVTPAVGDWHEGAGQLLTLRTPHLGTFQACGKKETYNLCVKVLNLRSLAGVKESRWAEFLGPDSPEAARGEADSGPPVEDCAWGDSHQKVPSAP